MAKLWQKEYQLNSLLEAFTVGRDYIHDRKLIPADCLASAVHAAMLKKIGLLTEQEEAGLNKALSETEQAFRDGSFTVDQADEDCHTAIENRLVAAVGAAGKKIHTGRSRNDQVIVTLRVYGRSALLSVFESASSLVHNLFSFAEEHRMVPMPGRTHMQAGMPSTVGLWAAAWAEQILDDLTFLKAAYTLTDSSPLGSAASYGVPLPLDREFVAEKLGFSRVQRNVLHVNNSRGKTEGYILDALDHLTTTYSKLAQDLILFSLPEFGYFSLPKELCSGSSIMPQKRNPDGLELMRAKAGAMHNYASTVKDIIRSLPSGYNRDYQETKEPFLFGLALGEQASAIMDLTIRSVSVHEEALRRGFTRDIYATDAALELVEKGVSFRDAYVQVGTNLDALDEYDPEKVLPKRSSTGTPGNLQLKEGAAAAESLSGWIIKEASRVNGRLAQIFGREVQVL